MTTFEFRIGRTNAFIPFDKILIDEYWCGTGVVSLPKAISEIEKMIPPSNAAARSVPLAAGKKDASIDRHVVIPDQSSKVTQGH